MGEKMKAIHAATRAKKEARQREIDRLDRELCKVFAKTESAGGRSGGTRPARSKGKDITDRFAGGFEMAGNLQQVSTDSASAARDRMNERLASDEPTYNGMNAFQAELARKRRRGEIPD